MNKQTVHCLHGRSIMDENNEVGPGVYLQNEYFKHEITARVERNMEGRRSKRREEKEVDRGT